MRAPSIDQALVSQPVKKCVNFVKMLEVKGQARLPCFLPAHIHSLPPGLTSPLHHLVHTHMDSYCMYRCAHSSVRSVLINLCMKTSASLFPGSFCVYATVINEAPVALSSLLRVFSMERSKPEEDLGESERLISTLKSLWKDKIYNQGSRGRRCEVLRATQPSDRLSSTGLGL